MIMLAISWVFYLAIKLPKVPFVKPSCLWRELYIMKTILVFHRNSYIMHISSLSSRPWPDPFLITSVCPDVSGRSRSGNIPWMWQWFNSCLRRRDWRTFCGLTCGAVTEPLRVRPLNTTEPFFSIRFYNNNSYIKMSWQLIARGNVSQTKAGLLVIRCVAQKN